MRSVVAKNETEPLDIEGLGGSVPIKGGERLAGVELFYAQNLALVTVRDIEGSSVESTVLEYCQNLVLRTELAEVETSLLIVKLLDVSIEPDTLATDCGNALALQLYLGNSELRDEVAPGCLTLDAQCREVILHLGLLELRTWTQVDPDTLGLTVGVDGEPENLGSFLAGRDVVVLVPCHAGDREPLGV